MIKVKTTQMISLLDWNKLVENTYGRPYNFQQQNGCQSRGVFCIKIPDTADDFENDTIPEKVNGEEMGVSFAAWLARDPNEWNAGEKHSHSVRLFWYRNFYPDIQTVANDLHARGLVPAGEYVIVIDW